MDPAFAHVGFYLDLSRVKYLSEVMLFGTDKFGEGGRDFYLNRLIEEIDHGFEWRYEF
jgi:hypothetical protein